MEDLAVAEVTMVAGRATVGVLIFAHEDDAEQLDLLIFMSGITNEKAGDGLARSSLLCRVRCVILLFAIRTDHKSAMAFRDQKTPWTRRRNLAASACLPACALHACGLKGPEANGDVGWPPCYATSAGFRVFRNSSQPHDDAPIAILGREPNGWRVAILGSSTPGFAVRGLSHEGELWNEV